LVLESVSLSGSALVMASALPSVSRLVWMLPSASTLVSLSESLSVQLSGSLSVWA